MKRILSIVVVICLLMLLGGAGWRLYQKSDELMTLSDRFSNISEGYRELSERYEGLSGEHIDLLGRYSELSQGLLALLQQYLETRGHGNGFTESFGFTESARELYNPNRGFYHMHGFRIYDEVIDYKGNIAGRFAGDRNNGLTMIEVNLQEFRGGDISAKGLQSLDNLLGELAGVDEQLILRFLYDWEGRNMQYEPNSLDVILRHIEQVSDLLKKYGDRIFLVQGLFVGNFGEMNNSRFLETEDLQLLAWKMFEAVGENTYMSVRTPAQWRSITGISDPTQVVREDGSLASRMGLFNDGMLGSRTDYGTYGVTDQAEEKPFSKWNRHEELDFQDVLCKIVPIGGEAVIDNEFNDFENALEDMKAMHVTYLNWDHDARVFEKWGKTTVQENSCFDGMDGLTYMERHLGYRLVLRDTELNYDWKTDRLTAEVILQNIGFAPVYREAQVKLVLYDRERGREYACYLNSEQDIRNLVGGTESEELLTLSWQISLGGLPQGELEVYFSVSDVLSDEMILLGNEQDPDSFGYRIGTLRLEEAEELWEQLRLESFPQLPDVLTGGDGR